MASRPEPDEYLDVHYQLAWHNGLAAGIALIGGDAAWQAARAQSITSIDARVVATNIPGASAISQVGTFLNNSAVCSHSINWRSLPPSDTQLRRSPGRFYPTGRGARSESNPGRQPVELRRPARRSTSGQEGSFLSIDPSGPGILSVPQNFAQSGNQSSTLGGAVQMFSANSPHWLNGVNNRLANTAIVHRGEQSPRPLQQQRLWPPLASECTVWRHRGRFVLDP